MIIPDLIFDPNDFDEFCIIGKGSFGNVKLVRKKGTEDVFALKVVPPNVLKQDNQKIFIREILTLIAINHPAVLRIKGFTLPIKDNPSLSIFTEFMKNGTLSDILKRNEQGKVTFDNTKKTICAIGIAAGMKAVHAQKILHRDLKPENIFLDEEMRPKIADFGLARFLDENNDQNVTSQLGSPYYMAPELFDKGKIYNSKIDVYSFSMVLLSLFSVEFKFVGVQPRNIGTLMRYIAILKKRYIIPEICPDSYRNLIEQCWSQEPEERPSFSQIYDWLCEEKNFLPDADPKLVKDYINYVENCQVNHDNNSEETVQQTQEFQFI